MRIPGFAVEPAARGVKPGDLLLPQQFSCEEELAPVCRHQCRGSHNFSACVRKCVTNLCSEKW
ncbi:hypothetical protein ACH4VX_08115 [Streptomyces sp. NPDC020731]|uniref:hypothetical protein n=1 Tax=Streptomyces sp. NPDC020731 TaxID=3365085 RepID=UPI003797F398